uniref:ATP-binding protein n=1 Tax=Nocardioides sp. TaxID=35761 RepID=UPI00356643FA
VDPASVDAVEFVTRLRAARSGGSLDKGHVGPADLAAYDEALGLWRGEALSDFNTEPWATAEAARLTGLRMAAVTERAQLALALGRHTEVVGDLGPMVSEDPTLESLAGLLMVALYRSARQAEALEVYARTRVALDDQLGLEPSTSLRSLHERVLRQDASLGAQPDPSPPTTVPLAQVSTSSVRSPSERPRAATPTNLPVAVRPLIGREHELDAITELVVGSRLVTLIGPGGAGKTSLAVAAAVRVADAFPDGAFEVRLSPVTSAEQVPFAFADALGVPLDGAAADPDVRRRLLAFLEPRRMLLLVDNCEHLVDAAAGLVDHVLGRCPDVTVLATSREALAVPDEMQIAVGPLPVPPEETPAAQVLQFPACQLFVERARLVRPGTVYGDRELLAVGRIARALDGIPLALELAAARVAAMSPSEISERLEQRFALLTSGARTAEARQQTLRAAVDWSHDLLTEPEQVVFRRLAVFRGGCTLAAAEFVLSDDLISTGQVLDTVGRLVDRSMLVAEPGPATRYRMLETVRHYAWERLTECDELETVAQRHASYFRGLAEEAESELRGHGQRDAFRRLRDDQANIREALTHFAGPAGDLDAALAMAGSLGLFWHLGRHLEGREVLARLTAQPGGSSQARARALQAVSLVERPRACLVHPSPRCAQAAQESLTLFEQVGDAPRAALSRVLLAVEGVTGADSARAEELLAEAEREFLGEDDQWGLGVIGFVRMETALKRGDAETAVPTGRATASIFRQLDDPWGLSATLYHLGWGLRQFGRHAECARVLEEAIDVASAAALHNTAQWALADLGIAHLHLGDHSAARDAFDRARGASALIGDGAGTVLADYGHGLLAPVGGDWAEARRRLTAAREGFRALGTPLPETLALAGLARCDEADGATARAADGYQQVRNAGHAVGEPGLVATALEGLARLLAEEGDRAAASDLVHEAAQLRQSANRPAPPYERFEGWSGGLPLSTR